MGGEDDCSDHFAPGSDRNIKLTTTADMDIFKAYIRSKTGNM